MNASLTFGRLLVPLGLLCALALFPSQRLPVDDAALEHTASITGGGCGASAVEGTLETQDGSLPFALTLRGPQLRLGGDSGAQVLAVSHAACSPQAITFAVTGPDGRRGQCALIVEGSQVMGDCTLPGTGQATVSAIIDRAGATAAPTRTAHGT